MKLSIQALVTSTAVAALFFIGTGMAHADKGGSKGGPSGGSAKMGSSHSGGMKSGIHQGNFNGSSNHKFNQFHHKSNYFGGTWNRNCYPSFWNYGWNFSFCNRFNTYPIYNTCYSTPLVNSYQVPVVTKVIEVVQPAPVVERVITTRTASIVQPRVFHTYSAFRP